MKTGITFSSFDLLHAGHITMLEDAKRHCDYLICGLQTDPTLDGGDGWMNMVEDTRENILTSDLGGN